MVEKQQERISEPRQQENNTAEQVNNKICLHGYILRTTQFISLATNYFGKADNSFQRIEDRSISISKKEHKEKNGVNRVVAITQHNKGHLFPQHIKTHQINATGITAFFFCIR